MKAQQKKEAQRKKQEIRAYRQIVQDHQKRQADDTRKMMKQREKEGKRLNKNLKRKRF